MKTALITGASGGIGADAARHLAARGYHVILVARRATQLERVAADIGESATAEVCDASSADAVSALAERVRRRWGAPDVIVNCAGGGQWKRIEDTSPDEALVMLEAPYLAAFNVTRAFMRDMLVRGSGVLIHVNSPAAFCPWPSCVGYASARWALRGLHESLLQDLGGTGVHSCHVVFARVDSPYFDHNPGTAEKLPRFGRALRTLSPGECGRMIAELADQPRAESFCPGTLRLYALLGRVAPGVVRRLLRL